MPLGNHPHEYKGYDATIVSRDRGSTRKHTGKNPNGCLVIRYRVDGVIISQHTACDFIVTNENDGKAYLIELKGRKLRRLLFSLWPQKKPSALNSEGII